MGEKPDGRGDDQAGTSCLARASSSCGSNGLPMKPRAPPSAAARADASSTWPLNMITGIEPWRSSSRRRSCQPSTPGITTSSSTSAGALVRDRGKGLLAALGLADRVAGRLEAHPQELAQPRIVVDDQDERPATVAAARAGAVDEGLEVLEPESPVTSGRVEGTHPAVVRPLADRRLRHAEELRRLPERQPVGLGARTIADDWLRAHLPRESTQSSVFLRLFLRGGNRDGDGVLGHRDERQRVERSHDRLRPARVRVVVQRLTEPDPGEEHDHDAERRRRGGEANGASGGASSA